MLFCSVFFSCESLEAAAEDWTEELPETAEQVSVTANSVSVPGRNFPPVLNQNRRTESSDPNWDITALDTAKDVGYLSRVEKSIILEMNKVRADPAKYARMYIRPELQYYNGRLYRRPGQARIQTYEGIKAVEECITALSAMESAGPLMPELGLSLGARDLAYEQERTGRTGHEGSDNSSPFTRLRRYGDYSSAAENLYYGAERAREAVIQLLIDDGAASRAQRANIMNGNFGQAGVSFATHPEYKSVCVITFAEDYRSAETEAAE
jgi:uncharacterized protein YkwD